jgi:hypothetical protein
MSKNVPPANFGLWNDLVNWMIYFYCYLSTEYRHCKCIFQSKCKHQPVRHLSRSNFCFKINHDYHSNFVDSLGYFYKFHFH